MTQPFPGGVRDTEGKQAYLAGPTGETVAIDLSNGAVLWRQPVGQPVAATATRLLALDRDRSRFVLCLLDAATGAQIRRIVRFGMPDWADQLPISPQTMRLEAAESRLAYHVPGDPLNFLKLVVLDPPGLAVGNGWGPGSATMAKQAKPSDSGRSSGPTQRGLARRSRGQSDKACLLPLCWTR